MCLKLDTHINIKRREVNCGWVNVQGSFYERQRQILSLLLHNFPDLSKSNLVWIMASELTKKVYIKQFSWFPLISKIYAILIYEERFVETHFNINVSYFFAGTAVPNVKRRTGPCTSASVAEDIAPPLTWLTWNQTDKRENRAPPIPKLNQLEFTIFLLSDKKRLRPLFCRPVTDILNALDLRGLKKCPLLGHAVVILVGSNLGEIFRGRN